MSYLNEDEADAFFHEGDAGTYDGGPALSLAPVGMADLLEDADEQTARLPSAAQLARRERMKRLVTTVVSTLAAGSALVFAFRITRTETDTASAASLTREDTRSAAPPTAIAEEYRAARAAAAAARETPPPAPPVAVAIPTAAEAPAPAPQAAAPTVPVEPARPLPIARAEIARGAHSEHASVASPTKPSAAPKAAGKSERAARPEGYVPQSRPSLVTAAAQRSQTSGHAPPTAMFPD